MIKDISYIQQKLEWMDEQQIWPNGQRYLWTDACGVVLLNSLYHETGQDKYLDQAEKVIHDVKDVLGREKGIRIGEAEDRYVQYYHYLAMWLYALYCIGQEKPDYHQRAVDLVKEIHPHFLIPGTGIHWKMKEDLSGPEPGYGLGAIDPPHGYVVYMLLDEDLLSDEIADLKEIVLENYRNLTIEQDLGLGVMLWLTHFFPDEAWARSQRQASLAMLDQMWEDRDSGGYYCRRPGYRDTKFAFTNYGISIGLQSADVRGENVEQLNDFFEDYRSGTEYDRAAITHVMACNSHFPGLFDSNYLTNIVEE